MGRNRESAAASRNKVRNRISELEGEVEEWKQKYEFLLSKIDALEKNHVNGNLLRGVSGDGHAHGKVSPCSTPASATLDIIDAIQVPMNLSVPLFETSSLPFGPSEAVTANTDLTVNENSEPLTDKIDEAAEAAVDILSLPLKDALEPNEFHVIEMTNSRPAVKITGELKNSDELNAAGMQDEDAQEDEIEMLVQEVLLDIVSDEEVVYPGQTLTLF